MSKLKLCTMMVMIMAGCSVWGQHLDSLYQAIDEAIANHAVYMNQKLKTIDSLRQRVRAAASERQRYGECMKMYEAYETFQNDSAAAYLHRCLNLAGNLKAEDLRQESLMRLVKQYSRSGFYSEAVYYLRQTNRQAITSEQLPLYHLVLRSLYGEMASYSHDDDVRAHYFHLSDLHRDTLFTLVPEHSVEYLTLQENLLLSKHEYGGALMQNDELLHLVRPSSVQFATIAFYRAMEYEGLKQTEQTKRWLAVSALCDIKNSVMDQASLWTLAEILDREGQTERSYRYVEYSWACNQRFSARMRSWTVSPVVSKIDYNQKERLSQSNARLKWMFIAMSVLALLVVGLYVFVSRKRHQLAMARQALHQANTRLTETNNQLKQLNGQLAEANDQLKSRNEALSALNDQLGEANIIKEEYIGQFFSICSDYIKKLEQQRITVARKVKAHQFDELLRLSQDAKLKEKDIEELNANFDMVFLHLFPNFVGEFNDLLQPEHRIEQTDAMRLPIVVRIYALVRLGIDDSYHIAQFLHLTPNTIYNYRSRTRQKALVRDTFDDDVRLIGRAWC